MSRILLAAVLLVACGHFSASAQTKPAVKNELVWLTDVNRAGELSEKSGKPIFAFFTGSDWCIWCHRIENDVFSKPEFKAWASKYVILLELDFPRKKQLSPQLAQQNNSLQQAFKVQGFPTIWIFNLSKDKTANKFTISALGSLGYPEGAERGREQVKFLADANRILKTDIAAGKKKSKT